MFSKALLFFAIIFSGLLTAQNLEIQHFGNAENTPLIFIHGGPGYNSVSFEKTTAEELAKNGFYVISYDRRGEGRNEHLSAAHNFEETFTDLDQIYTDLKLKNAVILGHSFGGVVGTLFAEKNPHMVRSLILVGVPISMQETLKQVIARVKEIYIKKEDSINLRYIKQLEAMDSKSIAYSSYTFMHAMSNGFYTPENPSTEAQILYKKFETDTVLKTYASKMGYNAPLKFWENENYTSLSLRKSLEHLKKLEVPIFGLYGKEDGLYSAEQITELKTMLGDDKVNYLDNCSHSVFIDQQKAFIKAIKSWAN